MPRAAFAGARRSMTAAAEDQVQVVADWSVQAALFTAEGQPLGPIAVSLLNEKAWALAMPAIAPGPKRIVIVMVTCRKPGVATTLRTPGLILVAAS